MKKNNLTKTEQLKELKEKRIQLYQDYERACEDGDADEAWGRVEEVDSDIITLIMSAEWTERE